MPISSLSTVCTRHQHADHRTDHWFPDSSYPHALFNLLIAGGLLLLYTDAFRSYKWDPPFRAYKSAVVFFFLSNVFLAVVPMIPPSAGYEPYKHLPYYVSLLGRSVQSDELELDSLQSHVVIALFVGVLGLVYWFIFFRWIPERNGYTLKQVTIVEDNGVPRNVFRRIPRGMEQD